MNKVNEIPMPPGINPECLNDPDLFMYCWPVFWVFDPGNRAGAIYNIPARQWLTIGQTDMEYFAGQVLVSVDAAEAKLRGEFQSNPVQ